MKTYQLNNETIYENMPFNGVNGIPKDCQIWQIGCKTCAANDGKTGMCSMVSCQFSKCLPHCSSYHDPSKIPDNCTKWHDGCNTLTLTKKEEPQIDGSITVSYVFDENSKSTHFMCSPIAWGKPRCLEYRQCMVDIVEDNEIEEMKVKKEAVSAVSETVKDKLVEYFLN